MWLQPEDMDVGRPAEVQLSVRVLLFLCEVPRELDTRSPNFTVILVPCGLPTKKKDGSVPPENILSPFQQKTESAD